jgi:hypothetical protein
MANKAQSKRLSSSKRAKVDYTDKVVINKVKTFQQKVLVGTPSTGNIRMEWASAKYGMVVPTNYSKVDMTQYVNGMVPIRYSVADAQNIIVNEAILRGFEWVLFIEHDTMPPADGYIRFNEYMRSEKYPLVSGLYFTRSTHAEPMMYRGRGSSYYTDWKLGDKVMCDGVPTGMLLISVKLLKQVWDDSPEYNYGNGKARRVFDTPVKTWFNEESGAQEAYMGTSDLELCQRIIDGGYLSKYWPELAKKKYPFMVDTNIPCLHIDPDGTTFPMGGIEQWCHLHGNL